MKRVMRSLLKTAVPLLLTPIMTANSFTLMAAQTVAQEVPTDEQSLEEIEAESDRLVDLARQQAISGQAELALQTLETALTIYQAIGDRQGEAGVYSFQGGLHHLVFGDYHTGIEYYHQAISIFGDLSNVLGEAVTLELQGMAMFNLGKSDDAIEMLYQALALYQEAEYFPGISAIFSDLGNIYDELEDYETAIELHYRSLEISEQIKDEQLREIGKIQPLLGLGIIYGDLERYREAIEIYQSVLSIQRQHNIGDRFGEADSLNALGDAYSGLGHYQEAFRFYKQFIC